MRLGSVVRLALAACLWCQSAPAQDRQAEFLSALKWSEDTPLLGGVSGLELSADGTRFHAISDKGALFVGRITRAGDRLLRIETEIARAIVPPRDAKKEPLSFDTEGLALGPDGQIIVSIEGIHRLWRLLSSDSAAKRIPRHPDFGGFSRNGSLEALAIDQQGRLYTLPERSGALTRPFPLYRQDGKTWRVIQQISRSDGFLPVGADFGPDGKFYLLERGFNGFGFRSRVRRFELGTAGDGETVIETPTGRHGNLEGLAVWRDARGAIRLTMVSDNNFKSFQRTEFVEYRMPAL